MTTHGLFIDGAQTGASTGDESSIRDPANGGEIARVPRASADDVDRAVTAAHRRYREGEWRTAPVRERRDVLRRIADLIRRDREPLARLESQNAGKPISAARGEISAAAATFDYYAGAVDKFHGQTIPSQAKGTLLTFREPIGVCAAITPWNFPLVILSWKAAPALAMGNSLVVKPAEVTPLTTLALAGLAAEAGLPPGAFNVVPGKGSEAGEALVRHPLVRKISFTGSTEVGAGVMRAAAAGIKRVSLELGGKSASLVFADADLAACVESSIFAVYDNAGQDCCARSRILVERAVCDEFVERFVARARTLRLGDTADESTEVGPLITPQHRETVEGYLEVAAAEGATRLCGGERPDSPGNFLTPAVYVGEPIRLQNGQDTSLLQCIQDCVSVGIQDFTIPVLDCPGGGSCPCTVPCTGSATIVGFASIHVTNVSTSNPKGIDGSQVCKTDVPGGTGTPANTCSSDADCGTGIPCVAGVCGGCYGSGSVELLN